MILWLLLLAILTLVLICAKRTGRFLKCIFFSSLSGLACLVAVGFLTQNCVFWNTYSVCTALVAGVPGVVATVVLNLLIP